eukprot:Gb_22877 [translate_table: standard]
MFRNLKRKRGQMNPCDLNPCQSVQHCVEIGNSRFTCICKNGFKYNGKHCIATACGKCGTSYTISSENETLETVGKTCGLRISTIQRLNPHITRNKMLQSGQNLAMLCSGRSWQQCGPCGANYVQNGSENISAIAGHCGINEGILRRTQLGDIAQTGTVVFLPCDAPAQPLCGPCGSSYMVESGDTMAKIADMCEMPISSVVLANPGVDDPRKIIPGLLISIPCGQSLPMEAKPPHRMAANYGASLKQLNSWFLPLAIYLIILFF